MKMLIWCQYFKKLKSNKSSKKKRYLGKKFLIKAFIAITLVMTRSLKIITGTPTTKINIITVDITLMKLSW